MRNTGINSEQELIARCRQNDKKAQVEVYKKYSKAMYNTALRIVKEKAEAEDVMQEAFLDAFDKIGQFQFRSTFGAWLKRIVVNKSLDAIRQHIPYEDIDEIPEPPEEDASYMNHESTGYTTRDIKNAMNALNHQDSVMLSLYLFEGYDHVEIAQILEISHNAARTRYSRARNNLIRKLKEYQTFKTYLS